MLRSRPLTRPAPAGESARRGPPSPLGEGKHRVGAGRPDEVFSFSRGEKVAEVRSRMRGLFPAPLRGQLKLKASGSAGDTYCLWAGDKWQGGRTFEEGGGIEQMALP